MTPRRALRAAVIAFALALAANPVWTLAAPPPGALSGKPSPRSTAPNPGDSAGPSPAGDDGGAVAADRAAGLSTPIWREPSPPLDLTWHFLALPEYAVDLAFGPLGFVVGVVERYRLDRRVVDLLQNDAGTIKVVPVFKFSTGDSLGIGATLELEDLLGRGEELDLGGVIQFNRDHLLEANYEQNIATLDGRTFEASVAHDLNHDLDYYGLGNDSAPADHRVIERRAVDALVSLEVFARGSQAFDGLLQLGYRRTGLDPGIDPSTPPLGLPGDIVLPPPDFGQIIHYALVGLVLRHDTRDTEARTQRGVLAEVRARVTSDLADTRFSALSMGGEITGFIPLLPLSRVLVGHFEVEGVLPPYRNSEIPFHEYVVLGRKQGLRGFPNYRFRDRLGWWGSIEYRYPIYRFRDSSFVLSPSLFADAGRVGATVSDLWHPTVHWDVGIGIAGELETSLILRIDIGYSREGIATTLTLGKEL